MRAVRVALARPVLRPSNYREKMNRLKIMTVLETAPEIMRLGPVVQEVQRAGQRFEHVLVSTAQPGQPLAAILEAFQLQPDIQLGPSLLDRGRTDVASHTLTVVAEVIAEHAPDLLLVQGDTTAVLSAVLAAFSQHVVLGQVDAGVRNFDPDHLFPGEVNRRVIALMADLHFAPTERARANLLQDGLPPKSIFVTGSPLADAFRLTETISELILAEAARLPSASEERDPQSGGASLFGDGYAARRIVGIIGELVARAKRLSTPAPLRLPKQTLPATFHASAPNRCPVRVRGTRPLLGPARHTKRRFTLP
jgi:UDP-N-acetylglucosamine 2-epimerase